MRSLFLSHPVQTYRSIYLRLTGNLLFLPSTWPRRYLNRKLQKPRTITNKEEEKTNRPTLLSLSISERGGENFRTEIVPQTRYREKIANRDPNTSHRTCSTKNQVLGLRTSWANSICKIQDARRTFKEQLTRTPYKFVPARLLLLFEASGWLCTRVTDTFLRCT